MCSFFPKLKSKLVKTKHCHERDLQGAITRYASSRQKWLYDPLGDADGSAETVLERGTREPSAKCFKGEIDKTREITLKALEAVSIANQSDLGRTDFCPHLSRRNRRNWPG